MERTQIYLSEGQTRALDLRAKQRGTTRSHLIREAVERYLGPTWDPDAFIAALDQFAGIWADRDDLDQIEAERRQADRDRLDRVWGGRSDADASDEVTDR